MLSFQRVQAINLSSFLARMRYVPWTPYPPRSGTLSFGALVLNLRQLSAHYGHPGVPKPFPEAANYVDLEGRRRLCFSFLFIFGRQATMYAALERWFRSRVRDGEVWHLRQDRAAWRCSRPS
jgi:hypothetical protein